MKIIWADENASLQNPVREELERELKAAQEFDHSENKEEVRQEKSPFRGFRED